MNYLSVENLTKSFGIRMLFDDITFGIEKGQKVAFIAKNGTGKSTLLKAIAQKCGIHIWKAQDKTRCTFNPHEESFFKYINCLLKRMKVTRTYLGNDYIG